MAAKKQQFDFGAVICSILDSDTKKWLASSKATVSPVALPTDAEKNSGQPASACDDKFRWLKTYPTKKSDRPVNEISEELAAWEAVIGWKVADVALTGFDCVALEHPREAPRFGRERMAGAIIEAFCKCSQGLVL